MISIQEYQQFCEEERGWTKAFRLAVEDLRGKGGGMLYVPAGEYDTYPVRLYSDITLYLETGALLKFYQNPEGFEIIAGEFEGERQKMYMPCIYAKDAENICVAGGGIIDGSGSYWWEHKEELQAARPYLMYFEGCRRVKVQDVRLLNSPAWTVHPLYCEDVEIRGISIKNPKDSPNTDGINPDSCRNVRILDCLIDVGDDCITLKAGTEDTPGKVSCENITISNCNLLHGHGGVVIGSEMSGGVRNVAISNCVFQDTDRGVRVKTRRGRGGVMERVVISNLIMENVVCPFTFNMYYRCGAQGTEYKSREVLPINGGTPGIRRIQIQNVMVHNASAAAGFFCGLPESPIEDIMISDCTISMDPDGEAGEPAMLEDMKPVKGMGIFLQCVRNVAFRNVKLYGQRGEKIVTDDTVKGFEWE